MLRLANILSRVVGKGMKERKSTGIGLTIGLVIGIIIGRVTGDTSMWIALGVAFGLIFGAVIDSRRGSGGKV